MKSMEALQKTGPNEKMERVSKNVHKQKSLLICWEIWWQGCRSIQRPAALKSSSRTQKLTYCRPGLFETGFYCSYYSRHPNLDFHGLQRLQSSDILPWRLMDRAINTTMIAFVRGDRRKKHSPLKTTFVSLLRLSQAHKFEQSSDINVNNVKKRKSMWASLTFNRHEGHILDYTFLWIRWLNENKKTHS